MRGSRSRRRRANTRRDENADRDAARHSVHRTPQGPTNQSYSRTGATPVTAWRVEFAPHEVAAVSALFRKQVYVTGQATYYKALTPKITVTDFGADRPRDYETAFDELFGSSPELLGEDLSSLAGDI